MPEWAGRICNTRDHFVDTAIKVEVTRSDVLYYKVLYGVQNPCCLALPPLTKVDDPLRVGGWGVLRAVGRSLAW